MSGFEYLIALVSVIAGIGLTRALSGLARIVNLRFEVRISDLHLVWTISLLIWLISYWWFTFLLASVEGWTIPLFVFVLLYGALIYFLLALLYPDDLRAGADLFEQFINNRKWFFATFTCLGLMDLADSLIKYHHGLDMPPMGLYGGFLGAWFVSGFLGYFTSNVRYQRVIAYSWSLVVFSFTAIFVSTSLIAGR